MGPQTVKESEGLQEEESVEAGSPGLILIFSGGLPHLLPLPMRQDRMEVGRDELLSLRVQDERVSRRHVAMERAGTELRVRDLGSTNGVFLNGQRLPSHGEAAVEPGRPAVLRIGRTLFLVVADLAPYQGSLDVPMVQDGIVAGPALYAVHKHVAALARSGQGLFLRGESGSGKEITARVYHQASPRHHGPLVAVNCATIPKDLAERLLFGTVRGAYSGAVADAPGYLQAARGGTLFLDEVAELDLAVQAKLLRVLETREVVPLGGTRPQPVDLGLCTATLRDLRQAVAEGSFRGDLYYRIGRPEVRLPPLRDRLDEIPFLLHKTLHDAGRCVPGPALVEACLLRPWPGNVRELCIEARAAATRAAAEGSDVVLPRHLDEQAGRDLAMGSAVRGAAPTPDATRGAGGTAEPPLPDALLRSASEAFALSPKTVLKLLSPAALREVFAEAEREGLPQEERVKRLQARAAGALLAKLEELDFRPSEAAEALGTSRTTLDKLMQDLRLPRAAELRAEEIERARAQAGGDLNAAARLLRVSALALKKRLAALNMR
jgi:DNA-binding NtrC family response regulator